MTSQYIQQGKVHKNNVSSFKKANYQNNFNFT